MASTRPLSAAERTERYDFIIFNIASYRPNDLQTLFMDKYNCKRQTARMWIKRGRDICREEAHIDRAEAVLNIVMVCEAIMFGPDVSPNARVSACKVYSQTLGCAAPIKFQVNEDNKVDDGMSEAMKDPLIRKAHLDLMAMISASKES